MHHAHYERLAESYDETWTHSQDFLAWMTAEIAERLALSPQDRLADVGGGTGLFCRRLAAAARLAEPVLCIDPSPAMLARIPPGHGVEGCHASMEQVAAGEAPLPHDEFDALLVKEAIHHSATPQATLAGLAQRLRPGGRMLVVTLPPQLDYPLFTAALQRFADHQPDPDDLGRSLTASGLQVSVSENTYQHTYPTDRYLDRVRNRCMSVLSTFTDEEIEQGVEEIHTAHPGDSLAFTDRFTFVLARRPPSTRSTPAWPFRPPGAARDRGERARADGR